MDRINPIETKCTLTLTQTLTPQCRARKYGDLIVREDVF